MSAFALIPAYRSLLGTLTLANCAKMGRCSFCISYCANVSRARDAIIANAASVAMCLQLRVGFRSLENTASIADHDPGLQYTVM